MESPSLPGEQVSLGKLRTEASPDQSVVQEPDSPNGLAMRQSLPYLLGELPIGLYRRTPGEDGRFIAANRTMAKLLGYDSVEDFLNLKAADFYVDLGHLRTFCERLLAEGQVAAFELPLRRQDGEILWGAFTATLVRDAQGEPQHVDGIMEDITGRKQIERELRQSESRLASLIDLMPDAAFVIDGTGVVVAWNRAIEELTGVSAEEMLGNGDYEYAVPFYGVRRPILIDLVRTPDAELERGYQGLHRSGDVLIGEAPGLLLQRRDKYLHGRARALRGEHGEYVGAIEILHDLTELKRVEQALRESEHKLRRILDTTGEGFWMIDNDAITIFVNDAMCATLGRAREEISGRSIFDFVDEHNATIFAEQVKLRAHGKGAVYEISLSRPDGLQVPCIFHANPLFAEDGRRTGAFAMVTNIAERKQVEQQLHDAKEAAEAASRAKSAFLANMSHEIRTPMNAILGFTQLMQRDRSLSAKQREWLEAIGRSGEHLLALINDILEMSKIEAGRTTLDPVACDLFGLIEDLATMFKIRAQQKKLRFVVETADDLPRFIVADLGKLRQVLINLMGNAVKFTECGGIVLRVASRKHEGRLRIIAEVEDTGPGIAPEKLARIFEYFEQAGTGSGSEGGTGLGLAISRQFVRLMGGDIEVRSVVGQGSLFRFEMETQVADEQVEATHPSRHVLGLRPGQPTVRILVVDDKEENRRFLCELLQNAGFTTNEAMDGRGAVSLFENWQPHLILMDLRMPVMDGYQAIGLIKAMEKGAATPIIAVSASAFDENRQRVQATGADDFIAKPYKEDELFRKLAAWLHVDYVYTDEPTRDSAEDNDATAAACTAALCKLPQRIIDQMLAAATAGYQDQLLTIIDQVALHDEQLALRLRKLATDYAYDKFLAILEGLRS